MLLGDGKVIETSTYDILTCFKSDADIDVQKPHRGYCQAMSSSTVATLWEATAVILFISEQPPVTPRQIWRPAELELIGQGTGGFSLVLGMTPNGPVANIYDEPQTPESIRLELARFFDHLGALANLEELEPRPLAHL